MDYLHRFFMMLGIALMPWGATWALDSVEAIDRAIVQLIEDGSALQHTITQKAQGEITSADLQMLAKQLQQYETKVEKLAREAHLSASAVEQPGYGKLLEDSLKLSQVVVGLADGVEKLAAKTEDDSAYQYQNTFETMIRAMLRLSDDIGIMADRILFTEEQIGIMADRIGIMADRILETQRIQNENIARVHDTSNRLIDKLELDMPKVEMDETMRAVQESRAMMSEQREAQQQMQEMKAQQQETQEQMQQLRGF